MEIGKRNLYKYIAFKLNSGTFFWHSHYLVEQHTWQMTQGGRTSLLQPQSRQRVWGSQKWRRGWHCKHSEWHRCSENNVKYCLLSWTIFWKSMMNYNLETESVKQEAKEEPTWTVHDILDDGSNSEELVIWYVQHGIALVVVVEKAPQEHHCQLKQQYCWELIKRQIRCFTCISKEPEVDILSSQIMFDRH